MYPHYTRLGQTGAEKTKDALITIGIVGVGLTAFTLLVAREIFASRR